MVAVQVLHPSRLQSGLPGLQRRGQDSLLWVTVNSLTWNASASAADCTYVSRWHRFGKEACAARWARQPAAPGRSARRGASFSPAGLSSPSKRRGGALANTATTENLVPELRGWQPMAKSLKDSSFFHCFPGPRRIHAWPLKTEGWKHSKPPKSEILMPSVTISTQSGAPLGLKPQCHR